MRRGSIESGFTLLEVLVVLAVLSVAAAIVWPGGRSGGGAAMQLRTAMADATGQLGAAREAAIRDGGSRCVALVADGAPRDCVTLQVGPAVTLRSAPRLVRFESDGSSSGARVVLSADRLRRTLTVVGATGQILIR